MTLVRGGHSITLTGWPRPERRPHVQRAGRGRGITLIERVVAIVAIVVLGVMAATLTVFLRPAFDPHLSKRERAGLQWGLYQAFKGTWTACSGASQTLDLGSENGMRVTVGCNSTLYNEGESAPTTARTVRVYTLDAVACNAAASCPDNTLVARPGYVERR